MADVDHRLYDEQVILTIRWQEPWSVDGYHIHDGRWTVSVSDPVLEAFDETPYGHAPTLEKALGIALDNYTEIRDIIDRED